MDKEIWKDIEDYEGYYQVSNLGRVKSIIKRKEKILKACEDPNGYYIVTLYKDSIKKSFSVHRLVIVAFIKNEFDLPQVDHIDRNKLNNNLDNLRWVSYSENNRNTNHCDIASSKYNGVSWHKLRKNWRVQIGVNKKQIHLGCFYNEILAALKFDDYCIENNLDRELNILKK